MKKALYSCWVLESSARIPPDSPITAQPQSRTSPVLSILITGRCWCGKSALINALLGETVVPERPGVHDKSRSSVIKYYDSKKELAPDLSVGVYSTAAWRLFRLKRV